MSVKLDRRQNHRNGTAGPDDIGHSE